MRTNFGPPVPELPVADVERAQQHYRDALGFEIGWLYPGKEIGSVARGNVDAWNLLANLAEGVGETDMASQFREALLSENHHLQQVRTWYQASVIGQSTLL